MKILKNDSGFSLIQILMSFALLGILSLITLNQQNMILKLKNHNEFNMEASNLQSTLQIILSNKNRCNEVLENINIMDSYDKDNTTFPKVLIELDDDQYIGYQGKTLLQPMTSFMPYNIETPLENSKAHFRKIQIVQIEENTLSLNYVIDRYFDAPKDMAKLKKPNYLGFRSKEFKLPLYFMRLSDNHFQCAFNGFRGLAGEVGRALASNENDLGDNEDDKPKCNSNENLVFNGEQWLCQLATIPTDEFTNLTTLSSTDETLNGVSRCFNAPIGMMFKRKFSINPIGGFYKEFTSARCASPVLRLDQIDSDGEVVSTKNAKFEGYDADKEFEGKVKRNSWAHCPAGSVVKSFQIESDRDLTYRCAPITFSLEEYNFQESVHCTGENISDYASSISYYQSEIEQIISELEDPQFSSSNQLHADLLTAQEKMQSAQEKIDNCKEKPFVSVNDNKTKIINKQSGEMAICTNGYFLSGIYLDEDDKKDFKIKCSSLKVSSNT